LAPKARLPEILEDMEDACAWVGKRGPGVFSIDPENLFVMGQSAGGYLTLMAGVRVQPRPRALVSFWGYGDIAGPWYSKPDPHYREQPLVSKEDADQSGGMKLYLYCRQQGLWPQVLTGHDPEKEPQVFDPFCPERNVTRDYPPTLLIHGTKDTDVPYELSVRMAKALAAKHVSHEFITIPEGGHGFSRRDQETATRTYAQVIEFLEKHRKKSFSFFQPVQPPRRFQVMAHRGEARQAPENSRAALELCIEDSLEWAEIDLRLTADG